MQPRCAPQKARPEAGHSAQVAPAVGRSSRSGGVPGHGRRCRLSRGMAEPSGPDGC